MGGKVSNLKNPKQTITQPNRVGLNPTKHQFQKNSIFNCIMLGYIPFAITEIFWEHFCSFSNIGTV